jgi:predicted PurR-regulated permease PerM
MNNSTQAQKGFKTFLLTLSISLIIFSVIYYVITNTSSQTDTLSPDVTASNSSQPTQDKATKEPTKEVAQVTPKKDDTVFSQLAAQKMDTQSRAVLSGATEGESESTETTTTVPSTGTTSITIGLLSALMLFVGGMYIVSKDPRKLAINSFEQRVIKKL